MIPQKIMLENFMSHSKSEIDFNLFSTALILGENLSDPEESNGVGKSTLIHAINFALFGKYPTSTIDKIIREGATKASVTFEFKLDNDIYQVIRERTKKNNLLKLSILKDDTWEDISQLRKSESSSELIKLLNISYDTYKNAYCFEQDDYSDFLSLKSPKDRLNILKNAFNLQIYDKLQKRVSELSSENNKLLFAENKVVESIGNPEEEIKIINQKIADTQKILSSKRSELESIQNIILDKNKILLELNQLSSDDDLILKISSAKEEVNICKIKLQKQQDALSGYKATNFLSKKDLFLSQKETAQKSLDELNNIKLIDVNDLNSKLKIEEDNIQSFQKEISILEFNIKKLKHPLTKEDVCPECQQVVPEEHRELHTKKVSLEIENNNNQLQLFKEKLSKSLSKKEKIKESISEQQLTKNKIVKLTSEIASLDQLLSSVDDNIAQINNSISKVSEEIIILTSALSSKEESLKILQDKFSNDASFSAEVKNKRANLTLELSNLNNQKNSLNESIKIGENNLIILNEKLNNNKINLEKLLEVKKKISSLDDIKNIYQILNQGFSPLGAPNVVITSVLDEFQKNTNFWLAKLRNGLEVQFQISKAKKGIEEDTFNLNFFYNGKEFDLSQLSGGQKFIIKIALKLGLIDTLKSKFNTKINLICFDEVDEHIDIAASKAFFDIIKELEKTNKILIITHKEMLKQKFSNYIVVQSDGNSSSAMLTS